LVRETGRANSVAVLSRDNTDVISDIAKTNIKLQNLSLVALYNKRNNSVIITLNITIVWVY